MARRVTTHFRVSLTNMEARPYRQVARAARVQRTRTAILDAVDTVFSATENLDFSLEEVAAAAGTTVQTILRHFGCKSDLIGAAAKRGAARVQADRDQVAVGDLVAVATYLARHYEEEGDRMLRLLALEHLSADVAQVTANGRRLHRGWVERVLLPLFEPLLPAERRRTSATLVAATDLLTWKVLRREQGLSTADYQRCVQEMLEALVARTGAPITETDHVQGGDHAGI
jgi:AcrR family transcriptional regulator